MEKYINPIPTLDKISVGNKNLDNNEENTYENRNRVFFAFIDALGFKNDYKEKDSIFNEVFSRYFDLVSAIDYPKDDWYAGQTSDSLYFYTGRQDCLVEFIKIFSYFNLYAMSKNIFFRGGIACGDLSYKENHQFYGQSVINAYLLESSVAHYPRVMIDKCTYDEIKEDTKKLNLVKKDETNIDRYYLSIFSYLNKEPDFEIKNSDYKYVKIETYDIEKVIRNNMKKYECDEKTYNKYSYLIKELDKYKKEQEKRK